MGKKQSFGKKLKCMLAFVLAFFNVYLYAQMSGPLIINPASAANNYIQFKNNGVDLGIIGSSGSIYGSNPGDLGLYVYGGGNLELSTSNSKRMVITGGGSIGIGTSNPEALLDVKPTVVNAAVAKFYSSIFYSADNNMPGGVNTPRTTLSLGYSGTPSYSWSGKWDLKVGSVEQPSTNNKRFNQLIFTTSSADDGYVTESEVMALLGNGSVGIGTRRPPQGYKLAVAGDVIAEKLRINALANWPDYVFKSSYQLTPLPELEKFIKTHQHLPEVPSAKEVAANGIEVGANQALLLKKVEELTLYIIEQNKEIKRLSTEVDILKNNKGSYYKLKTSSNDKIK